MVLYSVETWVAELQAANIFHELVPRLGKENSHMEIVYVHVSPVSLTYTPTLQLLCLPLIC